MHLFKDPTKVKALLIGCEYHNTQNYLPGCINDVECIRKYLLIKKVPSQNIVTMTDTEGELPTKENILRALEALVRSGNEEESTLFFHFSGHGSYIPDIYHQHLEEKDGRDECLIPLGSVSSVRDVLLDNELHMIISKLEKKSKLFLLTDCCHSGTCFDLPYSYEEASMIPDASQFPDKEEYPNIVKLSGCQDTQVSQSIRHQKTWKGALTLAFISVITKSKTWKALFENTHDFLTRMRLCQKPVLSCNKKGDLGEIFV